MSKNCKYIMLNESEPILFPASWAHDVLAVKFRFESIKVTSAGFVEIINNTVYTFGESVSLKLKPEKDDAYWIKKLLADDGY